MHAEAEVMSAVHHCRMAPEMLMGLICSSKSDIYSLGVPFISFMHHLTHCSKAYDVHHLMLATGIRDGSGS